MYPYQVVFGMTLYDVLLVVAVIFSMFMADRMGIMRGFSVKLQKVLLFSLIGAIAVGFLGAVLFQAVYDAIKTGEFVINLNTGMTFYGGLIFGVIGFLAIWFIVGKFMCKNNEPIERIGSMFDIAACIIPIAHGIGRIGCLTAGCCHGAETDAWYGIDMCCGMLGDQYLFVKFVPIQLFEALFLFALGGALMWLFYKKFGKENTGRFPLMPIYIVVYGIWRFVIEYFRTDDRGETIISFLSPSQLVAILMVVFGIAYFLLWFFFRRNVSQQTVAETVEEQVESPETGEQV